MNNAQSEQRQQELLCPIVRYRMLKIATGGNQACKGIKLNATKIRNSDQESNQGVPDYQSMKTDSARIR